MMYFAKSSFLMIIGITLTSCALLYQPRSPMHPEPEVKLIPAIIMIESSGNPQAKSHMGARGLMQLMPATANYVHKKLFGTKISKKKLHDPYISVALGTTYLLELIVEYEGDLDKALAAYNGGPGAVKRGFRATSYVRKIKKHMKVNEDVDG